MKKYERLTCVIDGEARVMTTWFESNWAMQTAVNRLAELEDKIEQGTLFLAPCKVYDKIWVIVGERIIRRTVAEVSFSARHWMLGTCDLANDGKLETHFYHQFSFGKDAFFSEADAQAKLKELRGEEE